jgi:hypothetical protein
MNGLAKFIAAGLWGVTFFTLNLSAATHTLVGWNDLGMHCMDADYAVFSILPPFNTIHAQLVSQGRRVTAPGTVEVTYQAVSDPAGSVNRSSAGKTTFWQYAPALYLPPGAPPLPEDMGLAGFAMPGPQNTPRPMRFDAQAGWWSAEGIPITPVDDAGRRNPYPLMRLVAKDTATSAVLASADVVLPVSDEMDCRRCHASGAVAQPAAGWVWDCDTQRDYRWNILQLHDELNSWSERYQHALQAAGYDTNGLRATAQKSTPVLCARCHASNALPGTGLPGIPPLTEAVHGWHAYVTDPDTGHMLKDDVTRTACYRCHPGSETRCLRGAMGNAVAADGSRPMDCQSCHGSMAEVGAPERRGWLDEPTCQNCHTGTATQNSGAIRFTSARDATGKPRTAANLTFATQTDVPVPGAALYRFSRGHGGLYCSACHGSPHAEFPSSHDNDNLYSQKIQGHVGVLAECTACHTTMPTAPSGGPHGLHPLGAAWLSGHKSAAKSNLEACKSCHGADLRGTVLSRTRGTRTLSAYGTKNWWAGFQVGCYNCHLGPASDDANPNRPAVVSNASANTTSGTPVSVGLSATDADNHPLTLRIVSQPQHGTVALTNRTATYFPEPDFVGTDSFTFAAWDGSTDSNLGTVTLQVGAGACTLALQATTPDECEIGQPMPFRVRVRRSGCDAPVSFEWSWGDGAPAQSGEEVCRTFAQPGRVSWQLRATAGGQTETLTGSVLVKAPPPPEVPLRVSRLAAGVQLAWPEAAADFVLESTPRLTNPDWQVVNLPPTVSDGRRTVIVPISQSEQYFRLRKVP